MAPSRSIVRLLIIFLMTLMAAGTLQGAETSSGTAESAILQIASLHVDQVPANTLIKTFCEGMCEEMEKQKLNTRDLRYLTLSQSLTENITAVDKVLDAALPADKKALREDIIRKGLEKMAASLKDDGTRYYPPGTYHVKLVDSTSFKGGLGMYVSEEKDRQGRFIIVETLEGYPAHKASLKPGDRLVKAAGKDVRGLEFHQLAELIIGDIGSPVTLTVEPEDSSAPRDVTLTRAALNPNPKTMYSRREGGGAGYLRFKFLGFRMEPETQKTVEELKEQKVEGLIIDLRNNAGYPQAAISLSGLFLPRDTPVAAEVLRSSEKVFVAKNEAHFKLPMVLLINEYSSSASTLMAEALRLSGKARIVGTPSRWRYASTEKKTLSDGSVITITTSYFRLPDGRILRNRGEGAKPDVAVTQDPFGDRDTQLERALTVLQDMIKGEKRP